MRRLLLIPLRHPAPLLALLAAVSILAGIQLPKLEVRMSAEGMIARGDPAQALYEESARTFGQGEMAVVYLRGRRLFDADTLKRIRAAIVRLDALPFVEYTDSLFTLPDLKTVDDTLTAEPFLDPLPETPEAVEEVRQRALGNPFARRNLLSEDGAAMAVNVYLADTYQARFPDRAVTAAMEEAIAPLRDALEVVFHTGAPHVREAMSSTIRAEQRTLAPLALLVLLGTLLFTLRRTSGALLPLLTAGLSILWTLGAMAALGIPLNVLTSIVPLLLIVVGSTEDIHLLTEFYEGLGRGYGRLRAIAHMASRLALAISLTFLTTFLGFLSVAVNRIELLHQFGLVAAMGLLLNFLITVTLVPLYLRYLGGGQIGRVCRDIEPVCRRTAARVLALLRRSRRGVVIGTAALIGIMLYGAASLRVDNDLMAYFPDGSDLRRQANLLSRDLSGIETFSIQLDGGIESTFRKVRYLEELRALQDYLAKTGLFDASFSLADYMTLLNRALSEQPDAGLPVDDEVLNELGLFVRDEDVRPLVTEDYSHARIVVRHGISSSRELNQALVKLRDFVEVDTDPGLRVSFTGLSILTGRAADSITRGQALSLLFLLASIFVMASLLFVNPRSGLLAILPNVLPIAVLFGVMGYADIPLDAGTAMVAAIAVGICVDDTMHFMVRYNRELAETGNETTAMENTLYHEAMPVISTSLALAAGFSVLTFSSFLPLVYFGLLTALVMIAALLAEFLITPIAMSSCRLVSAWDLMSVQIRSQLRQSSPLFRHLRPWQIRQVVLIGKVHTYAPGEAITRAGDNHLYSVLEGSVETHSARRPSLEAGEMFNESALLGTGPTVMPAQARTPTRALALSRDNLARLSRYHPRTYARLLQNLLAFVAEQGGAPSPADVPIPAMHDRVGAHADAAVP